MSEIETTPNKHSKIIDRSETNEDDQSNFSSQSVKTNIARWYAIQAVSYTHLRAHET